MKRRFSLFTYPVMDCKAAEAMLNRRAAEGWRLERVWLGLVASFVPAETPVTYCIDWSDPTQKEEPDYGALLADAGWERRGQVSYRVLYEAPAGTVPIQTDGGTEYRRFRRTALRHMAIGGGAVAGYLLFFVLLNCLLGAGAPDWRDWAGTMASANLCAVCLPVLPLLAAGLAAWLARMALRLFQWRRAAAGEPFPVPGRRSAEAAALCCLPGWLFLYALLFPVLLDIVDGNFSMGWAIGMIVGGLIVGVRGMDGPKIPRRGLYGAVLLALGVLALTAPRVLPPHLLDGLYPEAPVADVHLLGEDSRIDPIRDKASLLVAYRQWWEFEPDSGGAYVRCEYWNTRSRGLSDRLTAEYWEELEAGRQVPEAVCEGVWRLSRPEGPDRPGFETWLIRRGNEVLWVEYDWVEADEGLLAQDWLNHMLAWLEGRKAP